MSQRSTAKYCGKRCEEFASRERQKAKAKGELVQLAPPREKAAQLVERASAIQLAPGVPLAEALAEKLRDVVRIRCEAESTGGSLSAISSLLRLETELTREINELRAKDGGSLSVAGSVEELAQELVAAIGEIPDKYLDLFEAALYKRRPRHRTG